MGARGPAGDQVRFRSWFPGLAEGVHLASCSQGALPGQVLDALQAFAASAVRRGAPWPEWMDQVELARERFARLVGARSGEVAVLPNVSTCAYQVASVHDWSRRPELVTTDAEFPTVAHVWLAQRPRGARVRFVPERDGRVAAGDYAKLIGESTGLVSVPLVSFRNGLRLPDVVDVIRLAHERGAQVFVDAYQAAGVLPVDVAELGCDYLVTGGHKYLLGTPGIAFMYARDGVGERLPPQLTGWFGRVEPFAFDARTLDFAPGARRFETGTPAIPAAYAAAASLDMLAGLDMAVVEAHVQALTAELQRRLAAAGERLYSPADPRLRGPMVALFDDDPERLGAWLAERGIAAAPRGPAVRLSMHYYTNAADLDAACAAVREYRTRYHR